MKKMLMGMLAMLLVLTMGTTVFAANSPGTDAALDQQAQAWNAKVESVTVVGDNNTQYNVKWDKVAADKVTSLNQVIKGVSQQADVLGMSNLSLTGNANTNKGIKVTLKINPSSIKSGYTIYVLHQYADGAWETIKPSSVTSDGKVTVTLYSLSPVAVVQYPSNVTVATSDPSKNQTTNNNTNSNTSSTENNTNSNNTSGPSQSNRNRSNSNSFISI